MSAANDPLRGTVVLVRADLPYDPLDKQNQFGVVCESNLSNDDIFVDFKDKTGLYSSDSLMAFLPEEEIQRNLAGLPAEMGFTELKALTQIGLFLKFGGVVGELKAMAIARDHPAIQPLCTDILKTRFPMISQINMAVIKWFMLGCCFLPLRHLSLTSGYGYRVHPVTGQFRFHTGIDLLARQDTVFAVMPGRIAFVGFDTVTGVHIRLGNGDFSLLYGHLSQVFVLAGDSVDTGSALGLSGSSGRVTGEHLHFSVCYRNVPVNPLLFLRGLTTNVLQIK